VANGLVKLGVSANAVTNVATLLSIIFGALLYFLPTTRLLFVLFPVVLLLRMALNNIDGVNGPIMLSATGEEGLQNNP